MVLPVAVTCWVARPGIDVSHCPLCICDLRFVIKRNNGSPWGLVIYNGWFNLFHFYLVNCKLIIKI